MMSLTSYWIKNNIIKKRKNHKILKWNNNFKCIRLNRIDYMTGIEIRQYLKKNGIERMKYI